ncbi:hypothetical protein JCM10212_003448 [Sporobolomyces blumeae]
MQLVHLTGGASEPKSTTKVLDAITLEVAKCKKAVVLVGAGISTSAGIPDFRSKDVGLYARTSASAPLLPASSTLKGPALFSASVYSSPTTTAQHLVTLSTLRQSLNRIDADPPTATHGFLRILKKRGQLRRVYTQNIDALEEKAGLVNVEIEGVRLEKGQVAGGSVGGRSENDPSIRATSAASSAMGKGKAKAAKLEGDVVQLHGSIDRVRCSSCDYVAEWTDEVEPGQAESISDVFERGEVAECPKCSTRVAIRAAQRKRSLPSRSFLRPAITLYDETSPAAFSIGDLSYSDLTVAGGPDLMIVMGTSLKIPGFKKLVKEFAKAVKANGGTRVLVNREEIKGQEWKDVFDYNILSTADAFTTRVLADWKRTRPRDWVGRQTNLLETFSGSKRVPSEAAKAKDRSARPPFRPLPSNTVLPALPSPAIDASRMPPRCVESDDSDEFNRPTKRPRLTRASLAAASPINTDGPRFPSTPSTCSLAAAPSTSRTSPLSTPPSLTPTKLDPRQPRPTLSSFSTPVPIKPFSAPFRSPAQPFKPPRLATRPLVADLSPSRLSSSSSSLPCARRRTDRDMRTPSPTRCSPGTVVISPEL